MTALDRERFESILSLYQQAWHSFDERRNYEWKVVTTLWTGLALAIAGSVSVRLSAPILGGRITLSLWFVVTIGLFAYWLWGLGRANNADRQIAMHYERDLQRLCSAQFDEALVGRLTRLQIRMGLLSNWAHTLQLGVTVLLAASLLLANWARLDPAVLEKTSRAESERSSLEIERLRLEVASLRRGLALGLPPESTPSIRAGIAGAPGPPASSVTNPGGMSIGEAGKHPGGTEARVLPGAR
jgi:hypothetical protein